MSQQGEASAQQRTVFTYLLLYRWLALIPASILLLAASRPAPAILPFTFVLAVFDNLAITVFHSPLNRLVQAKPAFLGVDVLFCAALIAASGGVQSPYYLYSLSPLLAAAFFFQIRGGLLAAAGLSLLYAASAAVSVRYLGGTADLPAAFSQVAGFFLIAGIFGYPSLLLDHLRRSAALLQQMHDELVRKNAALERANRELRSVHGLAVALQSAAVDIRDVQERVLGGIVNELGFERAALALVDHDQGVLTQWVALDRRAGAVDDSLYAAAIPMECDGGTVGEVLRSRDARVCDDGLPPTGREEMDRRLGFGRYVVFPMFVRTIPVGVLIAESRGSDTMSPDGLSSARSVAEQGSLVLWTTRLCMERAQRLATQEERDRIAREIHDAVSQSLFGMAFTLEGCLRLLPQQPEPVKEKLQELHGLALRTMADMRRFIFDMWLGGLTTDQFIDELRGCVHDMGAPDGLEVGISVEGDITGLTPYTRKHLFRIAQEALANVIKHAEASRAEVRLEASGSQVRLAITDDGQGFDREKAASGSGMGLAGIRDRVRSIGGTMEIRCTQGAGTRIEVRVPRL